MSEATDEKYVRDPNLQKAVEEIRENDAFNDTEGFTVVPLFAKGHSSEHREAASCRKVPKPIRKVTNVDFLLIFWREDWDAMTLKERHRIIVHELMHVDATDAGEPALRRHSGDFCEIPEHDKESEELAAKITIPQALKKFDTQATLGEPQ